MESSTLLRCLFGMPFISVDEGNIVSGAPLGTRMLLCFFNNSPLKIDNVEIGPWRDRHQFNGNCIVFSWGNLHRRSNNGKKWVCAVQHSTHYVDVVVDMKRNCVAFLLSCCISEVVYKLASLFLIMRGGMIQHPSCQNGTEGCFVLVFFAPPSLLS